jgi:hypothetical protein
MKSSSAGFRSNRSESAHRGLSTEAIAKRGRAPAPLNLRWFNLALVDEALDPVADTAVGLF